MMAAEGFAMLKAGQEQLERLREAGADASAKEILAVYAVLEDVEPVTKEWLKESKVGVAANHTFFRNHSSDDVQRCARSLVDRWKSLLGKKPVSPTSSLDVTPQAMGAFRAPKVVVDVTPPTTKVFRCYEGQRSAEKSSVSKPDGQNILDGLAKHQPGAMKRPFDSGTASGKGVPAKRFKAMAPATKSGEVANVANAALVDLFLELKTFEFEISKLNPKKMFAGIAYNKIISELTAFPEQIRCGAQVADLPGVGKKSVDKINEFLKTGTLARLESYRRGDFD